MYTVRPLVVCAGPARRSPFDLIDDRTVVGWTMAASKPKTTTQTSDDELKEHIRRAEAAVQKNKFTSEYLQATWRRQLLNMSYMLILISLHQTQGLVGSCLKDIKAWNEQDVKIGGMEAIAIVLHDAAEYLLSVVLSVALTIFLMPLQAPNRFSATSYVFANACIPAILSIYLQRKTRGCIEDKLAEMNLEPHPRRLDLPVVLIFHVIATASYYFMNAQSKQHEKNLLAVEKLKKDLVQTKKKTKK